MSNVDVIRDYSLEWWQKGDLFKLRDLVNIAVITGFVVYFFGSLNMADKIFTFLISGKLIGTDYVLSFEQVCMISGVVITALLAKPTFTFFRSEKNRNKIKLRIKEDAPLALNVRISA
jgi:divalent metal cation (Fe/Co/Zn/Cd) transporter